MNVHFILILTIVVLWGATYSAPTDAGVIRGVGISYGEAQAGVSIYRIDLLSKDWGLYEFLSNRSRLVGHLELGSAVWDGSNKANHHTLIELGVTPILRWKSKRLYVEVGSGPRLISSTSLQKRSFSSMLQFGSLAGVGILLRRNPRVEIGFRLQHISNGDLAEPNQGIDFKLVQLRLRFKH